MKIISDRPEKGESGRAKNAPLSWYNANYSPIQQNQGLQPIGEADNFEPGTGEINQENPEFTRKASRLERFALQAASKRLLPGSRTSKCLRLRRADKSTVDVWKSQQEHGGTHYSGLQTCGSVWACPVCASKVSERRRVELLRIMEAHKAAGGEVLLLTLTFPHSLDDDLPATLKALFKAYDSMSKYRPGRALWSDMGIVGTVKATECTHGLNGWHPHYHVLIFCEPQNDLFTLRKRFFDLWLKSCVKAGLGAPTFENGCRLDGGDKASKYVSKGVWGLDHEMTKGHVKKSTNGRNPHDLLRSFLFDDDNQAGALFQVYALAFAGKRQLQYSNGLKNLYQVEDLTDDEIAARIEDTAVLLGQIEFDDWKLILKYDLRGEVLELARHGWDAVECMLSEHRG